MDFKALNLHTIATLDISAVGCIALTRYAEGMVAGMTACTVDEAAAAIINDTVDFTDHVFNCLDASYFIANNALAAAYTCDRIIEEESPEEVMRLNPFRNPNEFASKMLEHFIDDAVAGYAVSRNLDDDEDIDIVDLANIYQYFDNAGATDIDNSITKVYVPSPDSIAFKNRVVNAYDDICRLLMDAPDGVCFDSIVYNFDLNPGIAGRWGSLTLKNSLWACLTQPNCLIADMYDEALVNGCIGSCGEIENPISCMQLIESSYIADRVLIALGADLAEYDIQHERNENDGSVDFVVNNSVRVVLRELASKCQENNSLRFVV